MFTKATSERYRKEVGNLGRYEFTVSNIKKLQLELSQSMLATLDDAIVELFDAFTRQYYDEQSNNVHYYNGWKTNKAYVVNRKVIDRCYGAFRSWNGHFDTYTAGESVVSDIGKVFSYLDGKVFDQDSLHRSLMLTERLGPGKVATYPYCRVKFFKKGTVHIEFTDDRILKKFNLIGSQRRGWLPPNYGKAAYDSMTPEEQHIVDEIEGRESYEETVSDYEFYLAPRTELPALASGESA